MQKHEIMEPKGEVRNYKNYKFRTSLHINTDPEGKTLDIIKIFQVLMYQLMCK